MGEYDLYLKVNLEAALKLNTKLKEQNAILRKEVTALRKENQAKTKQIQKLEARIEKLERRLNKTSANSDKPPSTDSVFQNNDQEEKKSTQRNRRKRKRRKGKARELIPTEKADKVVPLIPYQCEHCGHTLDGTPDEEDVTRHQVWEIPQVKAYVTEYQLHLLVCKHCQRAVRAKLPDGISWSAFGPRLQGTIAMLAGQYRLSKRQIERLLKAMWDMDISRGGIQNCEQRVSGAIEPAFTEAKGHVQNAPVVNADETPWKERHRLKWLWGAGSDQVWIYQILDDRSANSAKELLGEDFEGWLGSDDYVGYKFIPLEKRQSCWSHLRRRFVAMSEFKKDPIAVEVGIQGLDLIHQLTSVYRLLKAKEVTLRCFRKRMKKIKKKMLLILKKGMRSESPWTSSKCKNIYALGPALFLFVLHPEIEPTNNRAERAMRHPVLIRKTNLGTQSETGSRFIERILTVTQSLKLQSRSVLNFIEESLLAASKDVIPPSLLPDPGG